jgi:drug/metabolite transporter (DMT)-like permease
LSYIGEAAALGAAFFWSWTAIFFSAAGQRIGSDTVNILRLCGAVVLLFVTGLLTISAPVSDWYLGGNPYYLALSGLIGLAIGDSALFQAMVMFGPRKATLILSVVPILTAFLAWGMLGEVLSTMEWLGVIVTVGGVAWVVLEKNSTPERYTQESTHNLTGLFLGLGAAFCQSVGMVLAKAGMGESVEPLAATFMRMIAGFGGMLISFTIGHKWRQIAHAMNDRKGLMLTGAGTVVGPFIGVWLSIVSIRYAHTGVAATLMGLLPIMVIPWTWLIYKEKPSPRAWVGTIAAVIGSLLLFE